MRITVGRQHCVHAAIPPLANGSSQPSIFNVAKNLRALGYTPVINEEEVKPIEELSRKKDCNWISIRKAGLSLTLGKRAASERP